MRPIQRQKRSPQDEKCGRCKGREDPRLKAQCFPEHVPVAERPKPEPLYAIRQGGPTAEDNAGKDGENEKQAAATARRMRRRPVNRLGHNGLGHCSTPFTSISVIRVPEDGIVACLKKGGYLRFVSVGSSHLANLQFNPLRNRIQLRRNEKKQQRSQIWFDFVANRRVRVTAASARNIAFWKQRRFSSFPRWQHPLN